MEKIDILMAYLITDVAREIFNDNRREYGDGLEKFEPNDLNNSKVIDLQVVSQSSVIEILEVFNCYRVSVLQNRPDITLLELLNRIYSNLLIK